MRLAMVLVKTNCQPGTQGRAAEKINVKPATLSQALTIIRFAPELTRRVLSGAVALDAAYTEATLRKRFY